jgi:chaperonin GroEL
LKNALVQPFRQLMDNAGVNPDEKLPQVVASKKAGQGFDVNSPDKLVDLKSKGIVDPARVTKEAIQNAVSIAATAMTMGALVVDLPEKEPSMPAGGGMPGGMGMM